MQLSSPPLDDTTRIEETSKDCISISREILEGNEQGNLAYLTQTHTGCIKITLLFVPLIVGDGSKEKLSDKR